VLRAATEDEDERLAKLAAHRAEQNEVDGAVDQSQDVEQIARKVDNNDSIKMGTQAEDRFTRHRLN